MIVTEVGWKVYVVNHENRDEVDAHNEAHQDVEEVSSFIEFPVVPVLP